MSLPLIAKRALALLLFAAAVVLLVQLVEELNRVKVLKTDAAELHHVRYGLLDADQWVERISAIIEKRVDEFELTESNREQVIAAVSQVLDTMLTEIERYLRKRNLASGGTWMDQLQGVLQQGLQDILIDFDKLRRKVPQYSEAVVEQLSKPEAKEEIKGQLVELVQKASQASFAEVDRTRLQAVLDRYSCPDSASCAVTLERRIEAAQPGIRERLLLLIGTVAALLLVCFSRLRLQTPPGTGSRFDPFKLFLLTGAVLILLLGGILTPMIEIEARITELRLTFLDEPIVFADQVLYFQTKSIFEVVRILAETGEADMVLVAVLITMFSVIFPSIKLAATYLYYFDLRGLRASAWIRFFALRSGKWSMADVMVVAMFMAYIGFDGLVASQLGSLADMGQGPSADTTEAAQVITTNGTALEPGFYLFLAFVLASLLLSSKLEKDLGEIHPS